MCTVVKILNENSIPSGNIHLQKFVSYLSDNIDEVPFNFGICKYVPFSSGLSVELNTLVAWGELEYSDNSYTISSNDKLHPDKDIEKIKEQIVKFNNILPNTNFSIIELYGTMYYYMRRTNPITKDSVISKFKSAKAEKYTDGDIKACYDRLTKLF